MGRAISHRYLPLAALILGCQPAPSSTVTPRADVTAAAATSAMAIPAVSAPAAPGLAASAPPAPQDGAPALIVEHDSSKAIDLYGAYLVDEHGKLGTMPLWPHRFDCPDYRPDKHLVPAGGSLALPPPTHAYDSEKCQPGAPLAAGRYVLRIDSGYGQDYLAAATIELPLRKSVRLRITNHADKPNVCTALKAERAARLTIKAASTLAWLPKNIFDGCDPAQARCGTLPLLESPPPQRCTISLHDTLLRIDRSAGDDALRGVTAWADRVVSYVQRPSVTRSSASVMALGSGSLTVEGITARHRHTHGGDASKIGSMRLRAHNGSGQPLKVRVDSVQWLTSSDCSLPAAPGKRLSATSVTPQTLPAGTSELVIAFPPQGAYQAHCDRFASRALLRIEGQRLAVTSEHEVARFEPLRH